MIVILWKNIKIIILSQTTFTQKCFGVFFTNIFYFRFDNIFKFYIPRGIDELDPIFTNNIVVLILWFAPYCLIKKKNQYFRICSYKAAGNHTLCAMLLVSARRRKSYTCSFLTKSIITSACLHLAFQHVHLIFRWKSYVHAHSYYVNKWYAAFLSFTYT